MVLSTKFSHDLDNRLDQLRKDGLFKSERVISSKQSGAIQLSDGSYKINLCANNYLGLANNPQIETAAKDAIDRYGFGMASVRFICGTQSEHKQLETAIAGLLQTQDCILYASCFDANAGLFETLLGSDDAIISDALNHASIIDGVRLCKAQRFRYSNANMTELEECLKKAQSARYRLIATDGVFSMDGYLAPLPQICDLAEKYDAMVMVDDSHAVGFMGPNGAGTPDHFGLSDRVDIVTGTLGKALGGASGGYTAASSQIVQWLRQRSRPYLFSNTLAPVVTSASLTVLKIIKDGDELRAQLWENTRYFRSALQSLGFELLPGQHAIIPVMLRDAQLAQDMAAILDRLGVYVAAFSYPVVPKGEDRIRTQMSASLSREHLDQAIAAFEKAGRELGVIK